MDKPTESTAAEHQEEIAWIKAFQSNDKQAFDKLVQRYQDRVFNLCYRFLGDYQEASDSAQEIFMKVYRNLKTFRGEARFSTWLYTIGINTCRNKIKSAAFRQRRRMVSLHPPGVAGEGIPALDPQDTAPSPLAQLEAQEKEKLIQQALEALPEEGRTIIILRDLEGLSYEEIGRITGLNLGTVKSKLSRARLKLREQLKMVM
jgi:RNA polymerase sigma-70 factor (ECF subfamily)